MTQADSVLSTPPTNTSATRRKILGTIAIGTVAALASTIAEPGAIALPADPIFAAIEAFRRADALCVAVNGDIPDDVGDCWSEAISVVMRTRPTTPAGLAALTSWARERADWLRANGTEGGDEFCTVSATIDDATRGMSGLEPWSPRLPAMPLVRVLPHPDAKLLALGIEYERLLAIEEPLSEESERLWNAADRLRYEKLGIDPDDHEAHGAALNERHSEWKEAREIADEEVGYHKAWKKMDRASSKTARVGKKILKIAPATMAGLLARVRVIETHDEILVGEPTENLVAEIRDFAKRAAAVRS
jgi:hypothetical protein